MKQRKLDCHFELESYIEKRPIQNYVRVKNIRKESPQTTMQEQKQMKLKNRCELMILKSNGFLNFNVRYS